MPIGKKKSQLPCKHLLPVAGVGEQHIDYSILSDIFVFFCGVVSDFLWHIKKVWIRDKSVFSLKNGKTQDFAISPIQTMVDFFYFPVYNFHKCKRHTGLRKI